MSNGDSLMKLLVRRVGLWKASQVISFLVCYGTTVIERDGERVSMEAYADAWATSTAKAYRDLARYRAAVPEYDHPHDLTLALMAAREEAKASNLFDVAPGLLGLA